MHESLRLYVLCKAMRWAHLPLEGGLYAQHPKFIDDIMTLMMLDADAQKEDAERREREVKNQSKGGGKPSRGRRGRGRMRK